MDKIKAGTMKELIDKAAVVAEIEDKINKYTKRGEESDAKRDGYGMYWGGVLSCLNEVRSFLDTLEVKETDDAYKQGYNDAIDKACDAYCRLCDTKECGDTGECEWVEKFRKRLMRQQ